MHLIPGPPGVTGPMMVFEPNADPQWYKTYEIQQDLDEVPCDVAYCPDFMLGFVTTVDVSTDLGQKQAAFIRAGCPDPSGRPTRSYVEEDTGPGLVRFTFPAGSRCFAPPDGSPRHRRPRDGEQRLVERGGDWRGNPSGLYIQHTRAEFFLESWAENQAALAEQHQRG